MAHTAHINEELDFKPFVFVLGVPSGGTSCVAHVLQLLGVDMGKTPNHLAPHGRTYSTCEDWQFFRQVVNSNCPWGRPVPPASARETALAVTRYVSLRRQQLSSARLLGCKGWVNWAATDPVFWSIPSLRVVRIERSFEDSLGSFLKYQRRSQASDNRDLARFGAYIGGLWAMANQLIPSDAELFHIDFSDLRGKPNSTVLQIADWLGINSTEQQLQQAADHINSD